MLVSTTEPATLVDLYGYTTMAVAALQVQGQKIATLEEEVRALRPDLEASRSKAAKKR